ncbi:YiiD C-terminal domain-containing protein [Oleiagrimonas sp.]|uniref:YiiD C-terminal domain-containing protein n=1 Tax=Oleiagrimonas sp. TaxID=2010330 RepID=UPI002626026B|nr:YiiD C-terminal domain-containing protein [Oleiagrimonas sp.]MDA3913344.1 YiiD C-terminal domain-containing protein [Oleiagrimonas sp.]
MPTISPQAQQLERFILEGIPLARSMQLELLAHDGLSLTLGAPLAPNVNDKGCAFGGSLSSLMTLAGWSLIELMLREHGQDCDVFVADSSVRYLAPVWEDLRAEARLQANADPATFLATLNARGKARLQVECLVRTADGTIAATLEARYVSKRRSP